MRACASWSGGVPVTPASLRGRRRKRPSRKTRRRSPCLRRRYLRPPERYRRSRHRDHHPLRLSTPYSTMVLLARERPQNGYLPLHPPSLLRRALRRQRVPQRTQEELPSSWPTRTSLARIPPSSKSPHPHQKNSRPRLPATLRLRSSHLVLANFLTTPRHRLPLTTAMPTTLWTWRTPCWRHLTPSPQHSVCKMSSQQCLRS